MARARLFLFVAAKFHKRLIRFALQIVAPRHAPLIEQLKRANRRPKVRLI